MESFLRFRKLIQQALLISTLLIPSSNILAQHFEGKVTYTSELKNTDSSGIPDTLFDLMYKDAPVVNYTYYYKKNNYKSVSEEGLKSVQIYEPMENRIYYYKEGGEFAFYSDDGEVTGIEKLDKTETILGMECNAIKIRTGNSEVTFFYHSSYKIEGSRFNETGAWEKYLNIVGSVPLKYIIKGNGAPHAIVLTAISVKEEKLADDFFRIPKFKKVMRSQF